MRITLFDSGLGGLSIFAAIKAQLPTLGVDYVSDNAAFPYGTMAEAELIARVDTVLHDLEQRLRPELIVVACNTASTVALPRIRESLNCPVVGVVPAIKPAAQLSKSKVIALIATPGTIRRPYTEQLIEDFAADCEVLRLGSSRLVEIAERKLHGDAVDTDELRALLTPLREHPLAAQLDCVILGCTHFPLLAEELHSALDLAVTWVDSGAAIAQRVEQLLRAEYMQRQGQEQGLEREPKTKPEHRAWFTAATLASASTALEKTIQTNGFSCSEIIAI